jgi:hypothetical protein
MVLKQLPSHTSGKMGGQPRASVFKVPTEVAPADNSGDPVDGDELIEGLADLIVDNRSDVGVDVVEINSHAAGAQILKPLAFRV